MKKIVSMFYDSISPGFGDMIARNEKKKLNEVFSAAESLFFTFITIVFTCTFVLITPFVEVYTSGITDVDYIRPVFGYLIVTAALFSVVRNPYSSVTLAAGHYKQTRNGAIVECLVNLLVSIVFVINFGLVGVAIGTVIAMFIRTCEFIYHSSKYILGRSVLIPIRKIILMTIEMLMIIGIASILPLSLNDDFLGWLVEAAIVFGLACVICLPINVLLFRDDFNNIGTVFRRALENKRRRKK